MTNSQRWLVGILTGCVLLLIAFSWFLRDHIEKVNDRSWIALLTLSILLVSTATLWFRFRHLPSTHSWLVRHVLGNCILGIGLFSAWFFDLLFFTMR